MRAKVQGTDNDECEWAKNLVTESQSEKIAEDQGDRILMMMRSSLHLINSWVENGLESR